MRFLSYIVIGLSLMVMPSFAKNKEGTKCKCEHSCSEKCSKGEGKSCKCKDCDCKHGKCKHGQCDSPNKKEKAEEAEHDHHE